MKRIILLLLAVCLFGSTWAQSTLKVMTFNKLVSTSDSYAAAFIQASGADIIGMQEAYSSGANVANQLGFYHYSASTWSEAIISRYPITATNWWGVEITMPDGTEVYMFNTHLAPYPYGPYDIRDGAVTTEQQAINSANDARASRMQDMVDEVQSWVPANTPVFMTGDFNEPSHLDWTQAAANAGVHAMKVAWPTSQRATGIGLVDSWRAVHPNEVTDPGNTWTPIPSANEVHDRIDIVYHRGQDVEAVEAVRFGPSNDAIAEVQYSGYDSDHRAMMVTYEIGGGNQGGTVNYGSNLLAQHSAEQRNLTSWVQVAGSAKRVRGNRNGYPAAQDGTYIFWLGNSGTGEVYQDVNVSGYASGIDAGNQYFLFEGYVRTYGDGDLSRILVEYRNGSGSVLTTWDSGWKDFDGGWMKLQNEVAAPSGTRTVRVRLFSDRNRGTSNDGYFDNINLKTGTASSGRVILNEDTALAKPQFLLYPNPATDYFTVQNGGNEAGTLSIMSLDGKIVCEHAIEKESVLRVYTSNILPGLYIARFSALSGTVSQQKIVIK